ncbi:MAG: hypothetical protein E7408_03220 [Ruminococcaceae bacterium]|nr:hypothetical protein [Oscillospiraceae bacterium]
MADTIKLKGGGGAVPSLADKEPAYSRTEKALYVGTPTGNEKVGDAFWEIRIRALEDEVISLRGYIDGQVAGISTRLDALTPSE